MKKYIYTFIFLLITLFANAQSDPAPTTSESSSLIGFRQLTGADTQHYAFQKDGWILFAGRSWVNKHFLHLGDSAKFVTPYYFNTHPGIAATHYADSLKNQLLTGNNKYMGVDTVYNGLVGFGGVNWDGSPKSLFGNGGLYFTDRGADNTDEDAADFGVDNSDMFFQNPNIPDRSWALSFERYGSQYPHDGMWGVIISGNPTNFIDTLYSHIAPNDPYSVMNRRSADSLYAHIGSGVLSINGLSGTVMIEPSNTDTTSTGFATQKSLLPYLTKAQIVASYQSKISINAGDYLPTAYIDSLTDVTTYLNTAFAAVPASGATVYLPSHKYIISGQLNIPPFVHIIGDGGLAPYSGTSGTSPSGIYAGGTSVIIQTSPTANALYIANGSGVSIDGITIKNASAATPTAGAGIYIANNGNSFRMHNTFIGYFYNNFYALSLNESRIEGCQFVNDIQYNMYLSNTINDEGDNDIDDNWFNSSKSSTAMDIYGVFVGGLRIKNNKFHIGVGQRTGGYKANAIVLVSNSTTSDVQIQNNSIEDFKNNAINISNASGFTLQNTLIQNNQISRDTTDNANNVVINSFAAGNINNVNFTGNTVTNVGTYASFKATNCNNIKFDMVTNSFNNQTAILDSLVSCTNYANVAPYLSFAPVQNAFIVGLNTPVDYATGNSGSVFPFTSGAGQGNKVFETRSDGVSRGFYFVNGSTLAVQAGLFGTGNWVVGGSGLIAGTDPGYKIYAGSPGTNGYAGFGSFAVNASGIPNTSYSTTGTTIPNLSYLGTNYAPLASPTFTGVPAVPTPSSNINTTQAVNGAWVNTYYQAKGALPGRTPISDVNYTQLSTDYLMAYTTLTAARTVTLIVITDKQTIMVKDESGNAATDNITINAPSGKTIDGASSITINTAYGFKKLYYVASSGNYFTN